MSQSLGQIVVHVIFSTKNRQPFLQNRSLREELHRLLGGILVKIDCQPLLIGGVEDHVHVLCLLARTRDAAAMVKELKGGSSVWLKTKGPESMGFAWQSGYGVFSIGHSQISAARKYIANQRCITARRRFKMSSANFSPATRFPTTSATSGTDQTLSGLGSSRENPG